MLAHVLPDDRCAVLSATSTSPPRRWTTFAAGDGEAWRRLAEQWADIEDAILGALFTPFPPVRSGAALFRQAGIGDALRLARASRPTSVRRFGDEKFDGEGGPILFAGNALHSDLSPEAPGSAVSAGCCACSARASASRSRSAAPAR